MCLNVCLMAREELEKHLLGWVESLSLLCLELVDSELRLRVLGTDESRVGGGGGCCSTSSGTTGHCCLRLCRTASQPCSFSSSQPCFVLEMRPSTYRHILKETRNKSWAWRIDTTYIIVHSTISVVYCLHTRGWREPHSGEPEPQCRQSHSPLVAGSDPSWRCRYYPGRKQNDQHQQFELSNYVCFLPTTLPRPPHVGELY